MLIHIRDALFLLRAMPRYFRRLCRGYAVLSHYVLMLRRAAFIIFMMLLLRVILRHTHTSRQQIRYAIVTLPCASVF